MHRPFLSDPRQRPHILLVPGLNNSGPTHWQTLWQEQRADCSRADLGRWDDPEPIDWVRNLDAAIAGINGPVVLVAHSLGCHAVAHWAAAHHAGLWSPVRAALLVAPPAVEGTNVDPRIARFAPAPRCRFAFPTMLAASQNDPYASFGDARRMARRWGSRLIDAGPLGHINADSDIADWSYGQHLLARLTADTETAAWKVAA